MHENPDIIIATPGRFVHVCVEMGLKLESVEYVVFDEADRLFEMGFGEQLREILGRLPETRQTVLFSATLPKLLVDFAKAGLTEPTLLRLDVDTKIPESLQLGFFQCRMEAKPALLLHLLNHTIPKEEQVVVFAATRHHVDYLHVLLDKAGIDNTFIYSALDPAARKINAAKFKVGANKTRVLIVTDLAARGIDIPMLDNVINYHFPAKAKLFVHRVGRCARAGRKGCAYSMVALDELPYFVDLQLFLGQGSLKVQQPGITEWHNILGSTPQYVQDEWMDSISRWVDDDPNLELIVRTSTNGYKQYLKSRPGASNESVKRAKKLQKESKIETHVLLARQDTKNGEAAADMIEKMKNFRPPATIFEIGNTTKNLLVKDVMANKRKKHSQVIGKVQDQNQRQIYKEAEEEEQNGTGEETEMLVESTQDDIKSAFNAILQPKALKNAKVFEKRKKKESRVVKDDENFIGYQSKDHHSEAGYSMISGFEAEANKACLDLTADDGTLMKKKNTIMRWDAKKKKYVRSDANGDENKKRIKTESGVWIPASYKTDRYKKWREKSKLNQMQEAEEANDQEDNNGDFKNKGKKRQYNGLPSGHPAMKKAAMAGTGHKNGPKHELKRPEEILKQRKIQAKNTTKQKTGKKKSKGRKR